MAKKTSKKSKSVPQPVDYKPSMTIKESQAKGQSLKVGKSATFTVKGRVIEEAIPTYDNPSGKKEYRMEIDKVSSPSKRRK
jgi:hypothetical protein